MTFSEDELRRMRIQVGVDQARAQAREIDALIAEVVPDLSPEQRNQISTSYESLVLPEWYPRETDGEIDGVPLIKTLPQLLQWFEKQGDTVPVTTTLAPLLLLYVCGWRDAIAAQANPEQEK